MRSVKFLSAAKSSSGEEFKEGSAHSLREDAADHWIKRGIAVEVEGKRSKTESQKNEAQEAK
jgi:hypothetical protein